MRYRSEPGSGNTRSAELPSTEEDTVMAITEKGAITEWPQSLVWAVFDPPKRSIEKFAQ
jgi:hypothetical protein